MPLKTLALRSFQIIQDTSITAVSSPFLCSFDSPCRRRSHHSKKLRPAGDGEFWIPRTESRVCQTCRVKLQVQRRWSAVSSSWSHSRHVASLVSPRWRLLSEVQMRCLTANHTKNFTFCGAQVSKSGLLPQSGWCLGKTLGKLIGQNKQHL